MTTKSTTEEKVEGERKRGKRERGEEKRGERERGKRERVERREGRGGEKDEMRKTKLIAFIISSFSKHGRAQTTAINDPHLPRPDLMVDVLTKTLHDRQDVPLQEESVELGRDFAEETRRGQPRRQMRRVT